PGTFARIAVTSPLVLVHVVSGAHNDVLLAGLVLAGLAAAARRQQPAVATAAAGVAFGLAAAVKVTPPPPAPFALPVLLGPRKPGSARLLWYGAGFAAAVAGTYAALATVTGHGAGVRHAFGVTSTMVQWVSWPTGVGMAVGYLLRVFGVDQFAGAVAVARAAGLAALAALLVTLWFRALRAVRRAEQASAEQTSAEQTSAEQTSAEQASDVVRAAGLALVATAVLGPVFYAWYAIAGIAVLATTPLAGRLRTAVTVAAGGLVFLTLPDSLG